MNAPDRWDPQQYQRFQAQRAQPFHDLLALVEHLPPDARVADLGCGTGELTRHLHDTLAPRETFGVDRGKGPAYVHADCGRFVRAVFRAG